MNRRQATAALEAVWTALYGLLWALGVVAPVPATVIVFVLVLGVLQMRANDGRP